MPQAEQLMLPLIWVAQRFSAAINALSFASGFSHRGQPWRPHIAASQASTCAFLLLLPNRKKMGLFQLDEAPLRLKPVMVES